MKEDTEGFLYPLIDEEKCTQCKQCEKSCPVITQQSERKPLHVYAVKNPNEEIRRQSSSGGMFTLLAEHIIHEGGVVFGARFNDNWEVIHDYTETIGILSVFRGSKYVQSKVNDTYKKVEDFLVTGRRVLFSGTPCQVSGLKAFLKKDYDNLLTVDLICEGVPSPLVWRKYLAEILNNIPLNNPSLIKEISFRDKKYGWKTFSFTINCIAQNNIEYSSYSELWNKNSYIRGFYEGLFIRPSCHNCPVRFFKSGSDITIGDYWRIQNIKPEFDDDKGISCVIINTQKGNNYYTVLERDEKETSYKDALSKNIVLEQSLKLSSKRDHFFKEMNNGNIISLIEKLITPPLYRRIIVFVLKKLGLYTLMKRIKNKV
jgi:coenzyme F420-reducing hydrogenase beta subunit